MNKFVDETGEMLNEIAMNGFLDDQCGSVTEDGIWLGLILEHKAIIQEDGQGFFDYEIFKTEEDAQKAYTYKVSQHFVKENCNRYLVPTGMTIEHHGDTQDGLFHIIVDAESKQAAHDKVAHECTCPVQCQPHWPELY